MRCAPARPMMTMFTWLDTWPMAPANCLVMFRKGTTMLMLKAMPEMLMFGTSGQQQRAAHQRHDHIHHVADVAQQRHQDVGKAVAVAGVEEDLVVDLVKVLLGAFLVAEDLDDLLAGHHFLHKGLGLGQRDLLAQEVLGGTAGDGAAAKTMHTTPTTTSSARMTL